jgi:hypothetical protein
MYQSIQLKKATPLFCVPFVLACFAFLPQMQAVSPPPDGGYPGGNTAEGFNALFHLSTQDGAYNTAVGFYSLLSNTTGSLNTAVGAGALYLNTGHNNTASGAAALLLNTTGSNNTAVGTGTLASNSEAEGNTAVGAAALAQNTVGLGNTAIGAAALLNNIGNNELPPGGALNTAVGLNALTANTMGSGNTAVGGGLAQPVGDSNGLAALTSNTTGDANTAVGGTVGANPAALGSNTTGRFNTAVGAGSLGDTGALGFNTTGAFNTAIGVGALSMNTTGSRNIAVGVGAGQNLTTGDNNIDIGDQGNAGEENTIRIGTTQTATYIAGIRNTTTGMADAIAVVIDSNGQLGTMSSSRRFKTEIKPMDKTSEAILSLKPVSFQYKSDSKGIPQFGLIAEEVAQVNPDLVVRDQNGEIYTVRYDAVNAMLLNEFLKEHRKVEQQRKDFEAALAQQQKQIEALSAGLQKVNAQLEVSKPAPQTVLNNQ